MAPPGASSPPPPAAAPALSASGACRCVRASRRSRPSLPDGPLGRLLKDDPSPSSFKDGLHRTLTDDALREEELDEETATLVDHFLCGAIGDSSVNIEYWKNWSGPAGGFIRQWSSENQTASRPQNHD